MKIEDLNILLHLRQYPLFSIGVNNNAYNYEDTIKIISYAKENIIPIIGCDLYYYNNSKIIIPENYNGGWYCDRIKNENLKDYVYRSCIEAMSFIKRYTPNGNMIPLFDICLGEEWICRDRGDR